MSERRKGWGRNPHKNARLPQKPLPEISPKDYNYFCRFFKLVKLSTTSPETLNLDEIHDDFGRAGEKTTTRRSDHKVLRHFLLYTAELSQQERNRRSVCVCVCDKKCRYAVTPSRIPRFEQLRRKDKGTACPPCVLTTQHCALILSAEKHVRDTSPAKSINR